MYDLIVVGGGAAGLTAAVYARRNGKTVLVIERSTLGGQITHSPKVENYPGTISMSGNEFADRLADQALNLGAELELENVTGITGQAGAFTVATEEGSRFEGRTVILATGVKHRMLGLPGEEDLTGNGVSYCAVCDGDFYAGRDVCVAGGGNSALQEAVLLSSKCRTVTVLQDLPFLTGEKALQEVIARRDNVRVRTGVKVTGLVPAAEDLSAVKIAPQEGGAEEEVPASALFVAIGLVPENDAFADITALNDYGYFASGEDCLTVTPGIFVAGDCRAKQIRQLTTACGDGAVAALAACRFVDSL